jgi:hypothetical protein
MSWRKPSPSYKSASRAFEQQAQQTNQQEAALRTNIIYQLGVMRGASDVNRELAEYLHFEGEQQIAQEHASARASLQNIMRRRGSAMEKQRRGAALTPTEQRQMIGEWAPQGVRQAGKRLQKASIKSSQSKVARKEKLKKYKAPNLTYDMGPSGRKGPPPPPPSSGGAMRIRA